MRVIFFFFTFVPFALPAQDGSRVDELLSELENAKYDSLKIPILKDLAYWYSYSDREKAKEYGAEMFNLANKSNDKSGFWEAHNVFGYLHYLNAKYDSAIVEFNLALSLSDHPAFNHQRCFSYYWLGSTYLAKEDFEPAEQSFKKSQEIAYKTGHVRNMANAHKGLGILYYNREDYYESLKNYLKSDSLIRDHVSMERGDLLQNIAILYHVLDNVTLWHDYLLKSLDVYKEINDSYGVGTVALRLGNYELEKKNCEKAAEYFLSSLPYFEENSDQQKVGEIHSYLGEALYCLKEYGKSLDHLKKAIENLEQSNFLLPLSTAYRQMGEVYIEMNDFEKAKNAITRAYELAEKRGSVNSQTAVMKSMATLYFRFGDYKNAYQTQQKYQELSDSLQRMKNSEDIIEIEAKYQNEQKQQQIQLLEAQNQLKEEEKIWQRNVFAIGILGALIVILLLYFLYKANRKTAKKLKEIDALKSHFFANISHEFRTPLTLISGPVEHRLKHQELSEQERLEMEMISRNSRRLLQLVDQLLDLSRIDSGGYSLKIEKGDVTPLLHTLTSSFEYAALQKDIRYSVEIQESLGEMWADHEVVQKIVSNLLSNAIKYTPVFGVISFRVERAGNTLDIICKNSGPGIPETEINKIFDRFYQHSHSGGGVGIGLALVKELAELVKGKIEVSRSSDDMTVFRVSFPVVKDIFPEKWMGQSASQTAEFQPSVPDVDDYDEDVISELAPEDDQPILLIVEDNPEVRAFIKSVLHKKYQILEAENGQNGIDLAIEHVPDIILSDVMMPEVTGTELCETLKKDERTSHIPIILLTARAGEENELKGFETGADDYITKPFNSEILNVRIEKLIETRRKLHDRFSQELILKPKQMVLTSVDEKFLRKVSEVLDKKLTESEFTAEEFSHEMGMSRMQLHRKLKALTGLSTNHFIRKQRVELAANLLLTPGINTSEVGYLSGFNNPSYFAKCFKEFYSCTPTEYIQNAEGSELS